MEELVIQCAKSLLADLAEGDQAMVNVRRATVMQIPLGFWLGCVDGCPVTLPVLSLIFPSSIRLHGTGNLTMDSMQPSNPLS